MHEIVGIDAPAQGLDLFAVTASRVEHHLQAVVVGRLWLPVTDTALLVPSW